MDGVATVAAHRPWWYLDPNPGVPADRGRRRGPLVASADIQSTRAGSAHASRFAPRATGAPTPMISTGELRKGVVIELDG
ncbi:MAG TPA: hypothetical protein VIZ22_01655, partial [Candidatus Limnocylindrales bacterium]